MRKSQATRVFTKWDTHELSEIKSRLAVLRRVNRKKLTNDHMAEAEYLAHAASYFADKALDASVSSGTMQ